MMGKVIMSGIVPQLVAPVTSLRLADITEGSIVKINENGSPIEFYVAKHNYESALNGEGRTLLVRKNVKMARVWSTNGSLMNNFSGSDADIWLNGTYKSSLDSNAQSIISTTTFYYCRGSGATSVTTLSRDIFFLSSKEIGKSSGGIKDGSELPIANILQIAYNDASSAVNQWTRTPYYQDAEGIVCLNPNGTISNYPMNDSSVWYRPCFTLPKTTHFDSETLLFKGVS